MLSFFSTIDKTGSITFHFSWLIKYRFRGEYPFNLDRELQRGEDLKYIDVVEIGTGTTEILSGQVVLRWVRMKIYLQKAWWKSSWSDLLFFSIFSDLIVTTNVIMLIDWLIRMLKPILKFIKNVTQFYNPSRLQWQGIMRSFLKLYAIH